MSQYIDVLVSVWPALLAGFVETLKLALVGIIWGSFLGTALGNLRGQ